MALFWIADPATSNVFPPCVWRTATGWLCPGCGSARALHAMMHGRLADAFASNALATVAIPIVGGVLLDRSGIANDVITYRIKPWHIRMLAAGIVGFGILRNVIA